MPVFSPIRVLTAVAFSLCCGSVMPAQSHGGPAAPARVASPAGERRAGSHLAAIHSIGGDHSNLTAPQQLKALQAEPGFNELPATTQDRMRETLTRLQSMPPEKRDQILARNEAMERLNPAQREQVRSAMKQLAELPPDERRYVARTFRGLRELPPQQRQAVLASERFSHLTDAQRTSLGSLMQVEPLLPPPYDSGAQAALTPQ
jgi:hypothetical protein